MGQKPSLPQADRVELTGTILKVLFAGLNPTDGKTFYILAFQPDTSCSAALKREAIRAPANHRRGVAQSHILVKFDSKLAVRTGQRLTLRGFFQNDVKFGWQFKALNADSETVKSKDDALLATLGSVLGPNGCPLIGRDRLKKIKSHFGRDLAEVLGKTPQRLREAVPALSDDDVRRLGAAYQETRADTPSAQLAKLQQLPEIGPKLAAAIVDAFGSKALATTLRDPYAVAREVPGMGFRTADQIALHLKLTPMVRARGLIEHLVHSAADENGHCGVPKADILRKDAKADLSELETEQILASLCRGKHAAFLEDDGIIWVQALLADEQKIAEWIRETLQKPSKPPLAMESVEGLTDEQTAALRAIFSAPVSILTGGPGTGKTTVLREVAARTECILCAPTGRAAKRLSEVTGKDAMTLHRLVLQKTNPVGREGLLVVDECSMADIPVMAALAGRCRVRLPRLLFVGDADQLPSVGAGQVFRDLISCEEIPVHRLTKNFRSASSGGGIVAAAAAVLTGRSPKASAFNPARDFSLIETSTAEEAAARAVELATETLPKACGLDPLTDIQVLTPMRGGPAGVDALNTALRERLNPGANGSRFAPGDRVINLNNQPTLGIFNGDLGVVQSLDPNKNEALVRFNDTTVLCDEKLLRSLDLAYAVTAHKSQGSEYPAVVIVLAKGHFVLLDRNLLYTAMTRAQRRLVIVAQKGAVPLALKDAPAPRRTRLASLLKSID